MTSLSVAATIASRSSWRSSARRSRSPVRGRRASTSSPSTVETRGNTPSSRPTRQTTRWGTDRIGTIVQTVSVPVRKLARVGRPRSRWLQQGAYVGLAQQRARVAGARRRSGTARGRTAPPATPSACRRSRSAGGRPRPGRSSSRSTGRRALGGARGRCGGGRRARRTGRRGRGRRRSRRRRGACPTTCRWSRPDIAAPSSTRRSPATQVLASSPSRPKVPRWSAS